MSEYKSFVALRPCGCLVMAVVDDPRMKDIVAKEVSTAILEGWRLRTVDTAWVRENARFHCDVCRPPKLAKPPSAQQEMAL